MKDKVLKLCRRLKKSSLSELTQMLEVDENEIKLALWKLEQEDGQDPLGDAYWVLRQDWQNGGAYLLI